jgi:hypothetical protein
MGRVVVKEVAVPIERIVENVITKEVIFHAHADIEARANPHPHNVCIPRSVFRWAGFNKILH